MRTCSCSCDRAAMDSKDHDMELISEAIKRLLDEKKNRNDDDDDDGDKDDEDRLLLSRLLSQVESSKGNGGIQQAEEALSKLGELTSSADGEFEPDSESGGKPKEDDDDRGGGGEIDREEMVKQLNKVKKQNTITHWLLSIMIVLTVAWQASEVTLLLKLKHGLSNPFRCIAGMFTGTGKDSEQHPNSRPSIKMPELPNMEIPAMSLTGEQH